MTVTFLFLTLLSAYQPKPFHLAGMGFPGGNQINTCGLNTAVPQYIRQFYNVPAYLLKGSGKQMAQIMRENFRRTHFRFFTELFHLSPDLSSAHTLSAFRDKYFT